ncbi:MAG TPA: DUF2141 domain-containing protein [Azospirillaceae bacterium]|nr:DUF2141 domain-containing protein [Azospirillaceae bacterium]
MPCPSPFRPARRSRAPAAGAGLILAVLAAMVAPVGAVGVTATAAPLTVTVANAVPGLGEIRAAIFDSPEAMDKGDQPLAALKIRSFGDRTSFTLDLPAGTYALRVFQDIDGDGALGRSLLGMPTEPIGFSNDAMGAMGPPSFDQAAVRHGEQAGAITVTLRR